MWTETTAKASSGGENAVKSQRELRGVLICQARRVMHWLAVFALAVPSSALPQPEDPPLARELNHQVVTLFRLGKYEQALPLANQALALREAELGPDHIATGSSLNNLAEIYRKMGQFDQALPLYERAVGIAERAEGPEHPLTGGWSSNLAGLYRAKGLYEKALPLYQQALAISEKSDGAAPLSIDTALSNLGGLYRAMGRYEQAVPLLQRALDLTEAALGAAHPATDITVIELGGLYIEMRRYEQALPLYQRALVNAEKTLGAEHPTTGIRLSNLANLLSSLGRNDQALPLYQRTLALAERVLGAEHPTTATRLSNLGEHYREVGRYEQALPLHQQALAISEKVQGADPIVMTTRLGNLARLYRDMGLFQEALPLYQRVLDISAKAVGTEHLSTAIHQNNLAELYMIMGRYGQALRLYQHSLSIAEKVKGAEHPTTATALNNLAILYRQMGSLGQALRLSRRAVAISEKTLGAEHPLTGIHLNGLASLYQRARRYEEALPMIQRALAIQQKVYGVEHQSNVVPLGTLASLYRMTGRHEEALPLVQRALDITEKARGPDHPMTGVRLNNLGVLYLSMGRYELALPVFHRALLIDEAASGQRSSPGVYVNLMGLHGRQSDSAKELYQPSLAIWYGKQAVNALQTMRGQMQALERELQDSFLNVNKRTYQTLANLLISEGRIAEAEQVLAMLKENELFELTRSADVKQGRRSADYVGREREAFAESRRLAAQAVKDSAELALLDKRMGTGLALTEAEQSRRQSLLKIAQASRAVYQRFLSELSLSFAQAARQSVRREADSQVTRLQAQVAQDRDGAIGLHYSVAEDRIGIIVSTPQGSFGRFSDVKRSTMTDQIVALRKAMLSRADTRPAAEALWKMLIEPVQADIQASGAKTLVVSLSDELRYLPLAALQNPAGRYLVEDYALALWAAAADTKAASSPVPWSVSALGLTQARAGFPALPGVLQELNSIVRAPTGGTDLMRSRGGVLPGSIVLDEKFNRRAFESALAGRSNVVHVASHFDFRPGDESLSVLLLGQGEPLSLGQLAVMDFGRVEQLTLSACDTATGGGINENGAEVEGLAAVVLRQRAQSVLATLWKVSDDSTALLMHDFYSARGVQNQLTRAQALRRAQLRMLRGSGPAGQLDAGKSINSSPGWRHPYYWAPFVLSGNWL